MEKISAEGHPCKLISQKFWVDEKMHPILKWLWANYFKTEYSCQGGQRLGDNTYILFYKGIDAVWFYKFLTINVGISARLRRREYSYGGGCSVEFNPSALDKIPEELSKVTYFDYLEEVVNKQFVTREYVSI